MEYLSSSHMTRPSAEETDKTQVLDQNIDLEHVQMHAEGILEGISRTDSRVCQRDLRAARPAPAEHTLERKETIRRPQVWPCVCGLMPVQDNR